MYVYVSRNTTSESHISLHFDTKYKPIFFLINCGCGKEDIKDLTKYRTRVITTLRPAGTILLKHSDPRVLIKSVYYSRAGIIS